MMLALVCLSGAVGAQEATGGVFPAPDVGQTTDADVREKRSGPAAVEIPLYAGARVMDVLQALNDKGFRIRWDKKQIEPTMKLLEKPKATRVDRLLAEILEPHGLKADRNQVDGGFRVRPQRKSKS
jgi:hypothetical protein